MVLNNFSCRVEFSYIPAALLKSCGLVQSTVVYYTAAVVALLLMTRG